MKTKFFKIVIPAFAIVLAVAVSAFTVSDGYGLEEQLLVEGFIPTGDPMDPCDEVDVECRIGGLEDCVYGIDTPVYNIEGETACQLRLSKVNP